jgi:hypothetical protein
LPELPLVNSNRSVTGLRVKSVAKPRPSWNRSCLATTLAAENRTL